MTNCGTDLFESRNIMNTLKSPANHVPMPFAELSALGIQIVSQLQVLHRLGYVHNDMKL